MMCRYVIVEDEFMVREGIKIKMKRTGLELELAGEADNGAEGLELILEQKPELALVDMQMNGGDGVTLMRNLREAGGETEIIIISAFTEFAYAQAGIQNDACGYLVKPFSEEELREAVLIAMGKMQKRTDSSGSHSWRVQPVFCRSSTKMWYSMGRPNRGHRKACVRTIPTTVAV